MPFWKKPKMGASAPLRVVMKPEENTRPPSPSQPDQPGLKISVVPKNLKFSQYDSLNNATRRILLEDIGEDPSLAFLPWESLPEEVKEKILALKNITRYVQVGPYSVPVIPIEDAAVLSSLHHVGEITASEQQISSTFGAPTLPGIWLFMLDDTPIAIRQEQPGKFSIEGYNLFAYYQMESVMPKQTQMK